MQVTETRDVKAISEISFHPDVLPFITGGKTMPSAEQIIHTIKSPDWTWYLVDAVGWVCFQRTQPDACNMHIAFLPGHRGAFARAGTKAAMRRMFESCSQLFGIRCYPFLNSKTMPRFLFDLGFGMVQPGYWIFLRKDL